MFYRKSFWDLLIFEVPKVEFYMRSIILIIFTISGFIVAKIIVKHRTAEQKRNDFLNLVLDSLEHPFCVIDAVDYKIKIANLAIGLEQQAENSTCHAIMHNNDTPCNSVEHPCPIETIKKTKKSVTLEHTHDDKDGSSKTFEVHAHPILDSNGNVSQVIEYCIDITGRKRIEEEREKLIHELQNALAEVKTLSGLLPICAHCKNIRDDKGYWNKIETYIHQHSGAQFSHGICPEFTKKFYPDLDLYDD